MARVLLGVTGSVAAIKTPELFRLLSRAHEVRVVATTPALYFFDPQELPPGVLVRDEDEWPRRSRGEHYQRGDPVVHIELRRWAAALVVAPLDAHTLARFALGLCDNCLACIWRAWEWPRPVLLAPAMNTRMWYHPHTRWHLELLGRLVSDERYVVADAVGLPTPETIVASVHRACSWLRILPPTEKELACGDLGVGAMADLGQIASVLDQLLASSAPEIRPQER
ncbi:MAG: phosphopantothenoylcysteine decarboxylase [Gemmataceae bacterium]